MGLVVNNVIVLGVFYAVFFAGCALNNAYLAVASPIIATIVSVSLRLLKRTRKPDQ